MNSICNANEELLTYFKEQIILSPTMRKEMRARRDSNRDRTDSGLRLNGSPSKLRNLIQGSYKMKTMVQHSNNDFDIDDGIIFTKESLIGPNGGDKSANDAKNMVLEALKRDSANFSRQPEAQKNCVTVFYKDGYHIDIPVYRQYEKYGKPVLELASSDWTESDPTPLADWFEDQVKKKSLDSDKEQMRRIVCMLKKWAKSRDSWKLPNGLIFSVYVSEYFPSSLLRDDEVLIYVLERMHERLIHLDAINKEDFVPNPVALEENLAEGRQAKIRNLKEKLDTHLPKLTGTLRKDSCTKKEALKAWADFFRDDFFKKYIEEDYEESITKFGVLSGGIPNVPVKKHGQDRYA